MLLRIALCASVFAPAMLAQAELPVVYTGRLLGYFRHPDVQTIRSKDCPSPEVALQEPAATFIVSPAAARVRAVWMFRNGAPEVPAFASLPEVETWRGPPSVVKKLRIDPFGVPPPFCPTTR